MWEYFKFGDLEEESERHKSYCDINCTAVKLIPMCTCFIVEGQRRSCHFTKF